MIPENVDKIITLLNESGHEAYLVGGCVRDYVLGQVPNDYDITTSAKPYEIELVFAEYQTILAGKKHGTIIVVIHGEDEASTNNFEITTYRIDGEYGDNRRPDSVSFTATLEQDVKRRDFTMNAICYDIKKGEIIDFCGGQTDIEARTIRAIGEPQKRFGDDALRILRGFRFMSQLDFSMEEETKNAIPQCVSMLGSISKERIFAEIKKLLCGKAPQKALQAMQDSGAMAVVMPLINPDKTAAVFKAIELSENDIAIRLALLMRACDDVFQDTSDQLKLMKCEKKLRDNVVTLVVETKSQLLDYSKKNIKHKFAKLTPPVYIQFLKMEIAFTDAIEQRSVNIRNAVRIAESILENQEAYQVSDLKIGGDELLAIGIKKTAIKTVLATLLEAVVNDESRNTVEKLTHLAINQPNELKNNVMLKQVEKAKKQAAIGAVMPAEMSAENSTQNECLCENCPNRGNCKKGKNLFLYNLAKLINVKTIITFVIIGIFAWLAIDGRIEAQQTLTIVTMVIAFYFGTQHEKKTNEIDDDHQENNLMKKLMKK